MMPGFKAFVILFSMSCISACAGLPENESQRQNSVQAAARQRWDYVLEGKVDESYKLWSPGSKAQMTLAQYRKILPRDFWTAADVESSVCEIDQCAVTVRIKYHSLIAGRLMQGQALLKEKWIKEDGQWLYVHTP